MGLDLREKEASIQRKEESRENTSGKGNGICKGTQMWYLRNRKEAIASRSRAWGVYSKMKLERKAGAKSHASSGKQLDLNQ